MKTLSELQKQVINEFIELGLSEQDVEFNNASDCSSLVCEIIVTDKSGSKIAGHIYKSFDKNLNPCFIARYYAD